MKENLLTDSIPKLHHRVNSNHVLALHHSALTSSEFKSCNADMEGGGLPLESDSPEKGRKRHNKSKEEIAMTEVMAAPETHAGTTLCKNQPKKLSSPRFNWRLAVDDPTP